MVRGFEESLAGMEIPFDEVAVGCAVVEDSPTWLDDSYAEYWSKSADDGIMSLPTTILPCDTDTDNSDDLRSVMQQCIKVHGFSQPALTLEQSLGFLGEDCASDFEGTMSDNLFSDVLSSDSDDSESAQEFASMFSEQVTSPPAPGPVIEVPRRSVARVRKPSRRLVDAEMSNSKCGALGRKRSARKSRPSALKIKKGGVRKVDTERMRVRAAARSRKEMKQVIKQFGATSTESRRRQHNVLERKRRCDLKSSYQDLRTLVPTLHNSDRVPTGQILLAAIEHIRDLQREEQALEIGVLQLRDENKRLKRFVYGKS